MVKGADKPETIHGEPHQREDTGKSYVASTQRRAGSYAEYPIFKTTWAQLSRSPALIGWWRLEQCSDLSASICDWSSVFIIGVQL
jgi:hypothetical protein